MTLYDDFVYNKRTSKRAVGYDLKRRKKIETSVMMIKELNANPYRSSIRCHSVYALCEFDDFFSFFFCKQGTRSKKTRDNQ